MFEFKAAVRQAVFACSIAAVAALGGCASTQAPSYATKEPAAPARVAHADMEDDGIPAQTPPPSRIRSETDDPNEPFSRNYGGDNPSNNVGQEAPKTTRVSEGKIPDAKPVIPADLPRAFRQKLIAALQEDE